MSQKSDMLSMLTAAAIGIASLGQAYDLALALRARVAAPAAAIAHCVTALTPLPTAPSRLAARAPT
jgi:hypothetical protein